MKIKTAELTGAALDWAVAECENELWKQYDDALEAEAEIMPARPCEYLRDYHYGPEFSPSTDWAQGGQIIDVIEGFQLKVWLESRPQTKCEAHIHSYDGDYVAFGPTPLIAAMRCFCCSKLGEEIDVPKELLK